MFRNRALPVAWSRAIGFLAIALATVPVLAEQQVTLKNGTVIIGTVRHAGENLEVEVGDASTLSFPLQEIALVSSTDVVSTKQGQKLLFRGLESLAMGQDARNALGLFAEAYRQSPDDPGVAYWYAWCLTQDGDGTAAAEVYRLQESAISNSYPRMSHQLAEKIKERLALEALPRGLVKKIDAIKAGTANQPPNGESEAFASYFRLVDQNERPIDESALRVSTSGDNETLEKFDDGYFLYTFSRRRSYGASPVRVHVSQTGLEMKQIEFTATRNGIGNAGVFTVHRYDQQDLQELTVEVIDQDKQPLAKATLRLHATTNSGANQNFNPQTTGSTGKVSFKLYPGRYSCSVSSDGYLSASKQITVAAGNRTADAVKIQLFPRIKAKLQIAWQGKPMMNVPGRAAAAESTTGTISISTAGQAYRYNDSNWINLRQKGKEMFLQVQNVPYGLPPNQAPEHWIGIFQAGEDQEGTSPKKVFEGIDLKELASIKESESVEVLTTANQGRGHIDVPVRGGQGTIFVGKCLFRDPRTGHPMQYEFKAWLEELEE